MNEKTPQDVASEQLDIFCRKRVDIAPIRVMGTVAICGHVIRVEIMSLGLDLVGDSHRWEESDKGAIIKSSEWAAWCEANTDRILAAIPPRLRKRVTDKGAS
jgi:hypothetical protein